MARRSIQSLLRRKEAHRIKAKAEVDLSTVELIRWSRIIGKHVPPEARAEAEREKSAVAHCDTHGKIEDPIMFVIVDDDPKNARAVYVCPQCSSDLARERWENEGAS